MLSFSSASWLKASCLLFLMTMAAAFSIPFPWVRPPWPPHPPPPPPHPPHHHHPHHPPHFPPYWPPWFPPHWHHPPPPPPTTAAPSTTTTAVPCPPKDFEAITCESGNVQILSCQSGVIQIQDSRYGVKEQTICVADQSVPHGNPACYMQPSTDYVRDRCEGKRQCQINTEETLGIGVCVTFYLHTRYKCVPAVHSVFCEGSWARMKCDCNRKIKILAADYGRSDKTTCSDGRPAGQVQLVRCRAVNTFTPIVAALCDGRSLCFFKVSNDLSGDPCGGTYKYLEVAYVCE